MRRSQSPSAYTLTEMMLVMAILATVASLSLPALMRPWARTQIQEAAQELAEQLAQTRLRAIEENRTYRLRWRARTGDYEIAPPFATQHPSTPYDVLRGDRSGPSQRAGQAVSRPPLTDTDAGTASDTNAGLTSTSSVGARPIARQPVEPFRWSGKLTHAIRFADRNGSDPFPLPDDLNDELTNAPDRPIGNDGEGNRNEPSLPDSEIASNRSLQVDQRETQAARNAVDHGWHGEVWFYPDGSTSTVSWKLVSPDRDTVEIFLRGLTGTVNVSRVGRLVTVDPEEPGGEPSRESTAPMVQVRGDDEATR